MKSFSWVLNTLLIPITSVFIFLIASFLFLGGKNEFELLYENLFFSLIDRSFGFALFGLPSLVLMLIVHTLSVWFENEKPLYLKITHRSFGWFLFSSIAGSCVFFFS
ncbi:MAG: hypothetical protein Roseis2KO_27820 [Roseivirga sp.]